LKKLNDHTNFTFDDRISCRIPRILHSCDTRQKPGFAEKLDRWSWLCSLDPSSEAINGSSASSLMRRLSVRVTAAPASGTSS
jgi:hypothetical protein